MSKFFLPQVVEQPLRDLGVRFDKIPPHTLDWSETQLKQILAARLLHYSRQNETDPVGRVNRFQMLCEGEFDADAKLATAAQGSPRALILLAHTVVARHCAQLPDGATPATLIPQSIVEAVLGLPTVTPTTLPLLFVTEQGAIFVGEQRLEPLPKLLNRCLHYLWQRRPHRVDWRDLAAHLYGDDPRLSQRGDQKDSLRQVINRLRQALAANNAALTAVTANSYIDGTIDRGFVLANYRERHYEREVPTYHQRAGYP